ncbi:MAG: hypothetical protein AAF799_16385 [Myxococcota bacterium]
MIAVRRSIAAIVTLSLLSSCATFLYPERKGNSGGQIDVGPLVLDILWFIPGLIPGVVALAVDFTTGAIYVGGGKRSGELKVGPNGEIAVHRPDLERDAQVELRLVDQHARVLDSDVTTWHVGEDHQESVAVSLADAAAELSGEQAVVPLTLELRVDGGEVARYSLQMYRDGLPKTDDVLPVPAPILASR